VAPIRVICRRLPTSTPAPRCAACDAGDRQTAQAVSRQFNEQPFLTVLAGFGLGYIAGLLIHGRS
jgi:hypothetical protein